MHAQKLVEKAQDAIERRAWDHAIEFFLQALQLDPDHGEGREGLRKAELEKYSAYYPSAISRILAGVGPRISAFIFGLMKNHEKKLIALERILLKDPKNAAVGLAIGNTAVGAGLKNAALAAFRGVLMSDADNLEALKGAGKMLYHLGDPKAALESYEKALRISPRDQEASKMRKNVAAEVSIGATGIDRAEHSRDLLRDHGETARLEKDGRLTRADEELQTSAEHFVGELAENPDDPKLHAELGARYAGLRQYDEAIAAYESAYELDPTNFTYRERAGDLKITLFDRQLSNAKKADNNDEAARIAKERLAFLVVEYGERVREHPTDLVLRFSLGKALYQSGDLDGAIAQFQQTNRDPRRKIESLTMLGNCFLQKGMFDLAENQLRKALEEAPGMSDRTKDILFALGELKEKQGDAKSALDEYKKIYEVDIHYRDVSTRMDQLKKKLGGA